MFGSIRLALIRKMLFLAIRCPLLDHLPRLFLGEFDALLLEVVDELDNFGFTIFSSQQQPLVLQLLLLCLQIIRLCLRPVAGRARARRSRPLPDVFLLLLELQLLIQHLDDPGELRDVAGRAHVFETPLEVRDLPLGVFFGFGVYGFAPAVFYALFVVVVVIERELVPGFLDLGVDALFLGAKPNIQHFDLLLTHPLEHSLLRGVRADDLARDLVDGYAEVAVTGGEQRDQPRGFGLCLVGEALLP